MTTKETKKEMKPESRFYIVETARQARGKIEDRIKSVSEKYVTKQYKMGKEFLNELKADPLKKIDDLIDDGKDAVKKTREERVGAVKQRVKETRTSVKKRFDTINTEKTKVVKGLESDARLIVEEAIEKGKKNLGRMPFKKNIENIEKRINKRMASLPSKLNLPSRDEIENLVNGIDGVNKKVDSLTKQAVKA